MEGARDETHAHTDETHKNADAVDKAGEAMNKTGGFFKSAGDDIKANRKEIEAAATAWGQYYELVSKRAGNSFDAQKQAIENWRQDQISKLDLNTTAWADHWKAINAIADERLHDIGIKTSELYDNSRQKLQDNLASAQVTYQTALENASNYSHDFLDKLHNDVLAARDAVIMFGTSGAAATKQVAAGTAEIVTEIDKAIAEQKKLDEAMHIESTYDLTTKGGVGKYLSDNPGASISGTATIDQIVELAKAGYTLQQLIENGIISMPHQRAYAQSTVGELLGNNNNNNSTAASQVTSSSGGPAPTPASVSGSAAASKEMPGFAGLQHVPRQRHC
jgi:hypothetical protein